MPFTPNNSEQRSPLTCYRGCWHVISRGLFADYRHQRSIPSSPYSSSTKGFYNFSAFFIHAASLRQTFVHCGIFLAAASRRSLGRISVPMCPFTLSGRIPIVALVGLYLTNQLMGRGPILKRSRSSFPHLPLCKWAHSVLSNISTSYPHLQGRSPTRYSPVRHSRGEQALPYRSTCMLKTRRQRSFWARIKLSIIIISSRP